MNFFTILYPPVYNKCSLSYHNQYPVGTILLLNRDKTLYLYNKATRNTTDSHKS